LARSSSWANTGIAKNMVIGIVTRTLIISASFYIKTTLDECRIQKSVIPQLSESTRPGMRNLFF
jgi:hypothetical protein